MAGQTSEPAGSDRTPAGRTVPAGGARPLDAVDRRIVEALVRDARTSVRTLAERLHISRTNAYARLERLVADAVLTGFHARVSPARVGLGTSAYLSIAIEQNTWREVSARLREVPYVEHFCLLAGDHDVLALIRAPDNSALRTLVLDQVQGIPGVLSTRTWLVFEEFEGSGVPW
jgi:DNA-binding Lrp family transcriptional regulator